MRPALDQTIRPAGLRYADDIVSASEESALISRLHACSFNPVKMHGVESKRSVLHFGWTYHYSKAAVQPAAPMPRFLQFLRDRAAAFSRVDPKQLEEVLVTRYPRGAGIGWHYDAPVFGEPVVGISLY